MLKIIGFLILAVGLTQGLHASPLSPVDRTVDSEMLLLEDCGCTIPQWKVNLILKHASQQYQYPLMDLMDAHAKGALTIDEGLTSTGDVVYNIQYAPCFSCAILDDDL